MIQPKFTFPAALLLLLAFNAASQNITQKLATTFQQFEKDPQLQSALLSIYIVDDKGTVVFKRNETIGLAPASTQKIITSATAYSVLGKDFTYHTDFGFVKQADGTSSLYIKGSGDPTLGSGRWLQTTDTAVLNRVARAAKGVALNSTVYIDTTGWEGERIPAGWIWEDIGNYYGAGAGMLNWRENQYDLFLRSGAVVGAPVVITGTDPVLENYTISSSITAAEKGSGDHAFIYFSPGADSAVVRGTIPVNEPHFSISGAMPDPVRQFAAALLKTLQVPGASKNMQVVYGNSNKFKTALFYTEVSPPLDSVIYWLNKKSINLYAEALLKTIAFQKSNRGDMETGMDILKSLWQEKGIPETALNMVDGSGLSPLNRVTTKAQVTILQYAQKQPWFTGFYQSLPEYNGMKLKSGTIRDVKGFAGYHTSRAGVGYTLSFLVNNYNGASAALVKKMYAVLDVLK